MRTVVVVLFLVGCGGKKDAPGPSCEQVVDHMLEVTKQQLTGHEGANFNSQKKAMVAQCEQRNMSSEMRTCLLATQTISDIAKCRGGKTDVLEKPRRPRPGSAAGSGSAGNAPKDPRPHVGSSGSAGQMNGHPPVGSGSAPSAGSGR